MNWINIKETGKLPKHEEMVLACVKTPDKFGMSVTIFLDSKKVNEQFERRGLPDRMDIETEPYSFVSQEIKGNVLNNVTHWCPLEAP